MAIVELEGKGFTHKTKNEYAISASSIYEWAKEHYVTDNQIVNPWKGIVKKRAIGEGKRRHKRDSFQFDGLMEIFSHKVFSEGKLGYSYITKKFCLYQYWIPLLALAAGLRGNEVAQLYRSDIVVRNGHYFIYINNSRVDQSIKNEHAERYVKVSEELIRLGFLQFIDLYSENERLFPELKHYPRDGYFKNAGECSERTLNTK